ncbi:MAG: LCP family protein [Clostridiaceae bacterium]|nr:LCP family protein [Clostridiaceae bacterium]
MNDRAQDDELERMRARRRASARSGRTAPARGRKAQEYNYDDAYYEEEYSYDGEDRLQDILIGDEPKEWEGQSSGRSRRYSSLGAARNADRYKTASRTRKNTALFSSKTVSDRKGTKAGQSLNGRNRRSNAAGRKGASQAQKGRVVKRKKRHGWKSIVLLLLTLFIGYGAWLFLHRPTGYWTVAVFGVDSRDGSTDKALADVQMICNIDRSTGEIKLVSVYRDTYLKINSDGTYHKINEAYFKGGHKQAVDALEENLDIKIDDYAAFNWKTVAEAINILGGVDMELTQDEFKYINSFITETVESTGIASVHLTQPGMNHLDGVQAVAYCRLRLMDSDFQRTERQRKVVTLALDKAKQADMSTLTSLAGYLIQQISTSVGLDDVLPLVKDIDKYYIGETTGFPFSRQTMRVGRMDCVIATTLESNVVLLHQFLYGEDISYSPSSAVRKISARISEETGLYDAGKAAPGKGSSGGEASGNKGGDKAPVSPAPSETERFETLPDESDPLEESTEKSSEETAEEREEATEETPESEEIGPGVSDNPVKAQEPTTSEDEEKGPGAEETEAVIRPAKEQEGTDASETSGSAGTSFGGPGEIGPGV